MVCCYTVNNTQCKVVKVTRTYTEIPLTVLKTY